MKFYNESIDSLLNFFKVNKTTGKNSSEIPALLEKFGKNILKEKKKQGVLSVFLDQFKDFLVIILIVAAGISFLSGNKESTVVILVVITMNAILGTIQHVKAEKSLESLKKISSPKATVLRDGKKQEILSEELVPGDIVLVEAGNIIPADARVISSHSLMVNESSLTGEAESIEKTEKTISDIDIPLGDQKNMVFSGSLVTYGRGVLLVTSTGMKTELGKIASLLDETEESMTPLQRALEKFGKKLSISIIVLCAVVFFINLYRGINLLESLMFAVALAVAAIPEALGSIVTIVLAIGTQKMAKENAIVKKLHSVESLGSISVICSDKTGTLTQNKMTVTKVFLQNDFKETLNTNDLNNINFLENIILCSDATKEIGDPTEVALIHFSNKHDLDEIAIREKYPRICENPFDSTRKMMSTLHKKNNNFLMITKGAPDVILERVLINDIEKENIRKANNIMAEMGLRVLAIAEKTISTDTISLEDENNLTFVGLLGIVDPPREESISAVKDCIRAGIKPVMITGDHKITAISIAKQIGIFKDGDMSLTGVELDKLSDTELLEIVPKTSVYARVSPEHKIKIVDTWQKLGNICAMTGDGVNDAPALKKADVGIAMGITGTEVSKDAASMILMDDNFSTIVKSIITGRNLYANIKNSIRFLLSGNMAGILAVFYSSLAGLPMVFEPVHLLFINLLTDSLPAIAIGMEPAHDDILNEKPREANTALLDKHLSSRILMEGFLIAIVTMIGFYIGFKNNNHSIAATMAFSILCLARLFHGFNCRGNGSIFKLGVFKNKFSIWAFLIGTGLLYSVLLIPSLHPMFAIGNINIEHFIIINILAFIPTLIIQILKQIKYK